MVTSGALARFHHVTNVFATQIHSASFMVCFFYCFISFFQRNCSLLLFYLFKQAGEEDLRARNSSIRRKKCAGNCERQRPIYKQFFASDRAISCSRIPPQPHIHPLRQGQREVAKYIRSMNYVKKRWITQKNQTKTQSG